MFNDVKDEGKRVQGQNVLLKVRTGDKLVDGNGRCCESARCCLPQSVEQMPALEQSETGYKMFQREPSCGLNTKIRKQERVNVEGYKAMIEAELI